MKTLFLILFFGKTTLLTSSPITIDNFSVTITLKKPISAITDGASLLIDVTAMILGEEKKSIHQIRKNIDAMFSDYQVTAELIGSLGKINLEYSGRSMINDKQVFLILSSNAKLSELGSWSEVKIYTSKKLSNVNILWRNFTK